MNPVTQTPKDPGKVVSYNVTLAQAEAVRKLAYETRVSQSEHVRRALADYLAKLEARVN